MHRYPDVLNQINREVFENKTPMVKTHGVCVTIIREIEHLATAHTAKIVHQFLIS